MTSTTSAKLWFIKVVDFIVKEHRNMEPLAKKDGQLYHALWERSERLAVNLRLNMGSILCIAQI